jgi:nicotinate phosphoribosyltransferase
MVKEPAGREFFVATADEIRAGRTSDVYFHRTLEVLRKAGKDREPVVAEVSTGGLPNAWTWGVFCGLEEVVQLLRDRNVSVWALPEGSLFPARTAGGVPVPVMILDGPYGDWAVFETPLLGMICQASGIATRAARLRKIAGTKQIFSFGVRRMHPGIAPLIERAAYVGGLDSVTTPLGAEMLGLPPMGTMPHALAIVMGGSREAFLALHKHLEKKVPRIALVDTYYDEKTEAILASETIPDLAGVRLDTPSSRRGDFAAIVREVRWELDLRGHHDAKIYVSGAIDEATMPALLDAGVDGFGVGTYLSSAATIDFALDIVELRGKPVAKRGKFGGRKDLARCPKDGTYEVGVRMCPVCEGAMSPAYEHYLDRGNLVADLPPASRIRARTLAELERVSAVL